MVRDRKAFQDYSPDDLSYCYGCGRLNEHSHHIKSSWDGDESVAVFMPKPYHTAIPGYVYGGPSLLTRSTASRGTRNGRFALDPSVPPLECNSPDRGIHEAANRPLLFPCSAHPVVCRPGLRAGVVHREHPFRRIRW
jgi:hypothetical protein